MPKGNFSTLRIDLFILKPKRPISVFNLNTPHVHIGFLGSCFGHCSVLVGSFEFLVQTPHLSTSRSSEHKQPCSHISRCLVLFIILFFFSGRVIVSEHVCFILILSLVSAPAL